MEAFYWEECINEKGISLLAVSEMAKYGFLLVIAFLTSWALRFSDRYMLEFFWGSQEVGIYSVSYNLSERTIFMLSYLFIMVSGPISMSIWGKEGIGASKEFLTKLTRYILTAADHASKLGYARMYKNRSSKAKPIPIVKTKNRVV